MIVTTTTAGVLDTRSGKMTNSEILENLQEKRTKCTVWSRVMGERAPLEDDDCSSSVRERVSGAYRASDASDGVKNTTDPSRALTSAKKASIKSAYFLSKIN